MEVEGERGEEGGEGVRVMGKVGWIYVRRGVWSCGGHAEEQNFFGWFSWSEFREQKQIEQLKHSGHVCRTLPSRRLAFSYRWRRLINQENFRTNKQIWAQWRWTSSSFIHTVCVSVKQQRSHYSRHVSVCFCNACWVIILNITVNFCF